MIQNIFSHMKKNSYRLQCYNFRQKLLICSFLAEIIAVPAGCGMILVCPNFCRNMHENEEIGPREDTYPSFALDPPLNPKVVS